MRRLKEQVKAGEITAADAIRELDRVASKSGDSRYVKQTKTYHWLQRKIQSNWRASDATN